MKEQILEPVLRYLRKRRVLPVIKQFKNCTILDIGCGWEARLLKDIEPYISKGVGLDFKAPEINSDKIQTIKCTIHNKLPFEDNSFDVVTMLAVLEHLSEPQKMVNEVFRVLKKDGIFCGTVPSIWSKPILEFLSYKLNIINPNEIKDHKDYYNQDKLYNLLNNVGFKDIKHSYFQLFMNNNFFAKK